MKKKSYNLIQQEKDVLRTAGFTLQEYSDVHYRVFKRGSVVAVDVWPTASKYMQVGGTGAQFYTNLLSSVQECFGGKDYLYSQAKSSIERMSTFKDQLHKWLASKNIYETH